MTTHTPGAIRVLLAKHGYLADDQLATTIFLADALNQPLLLEGEPGVGKTAVAVTLARATGARLIRLQCYEGIDIHEALYDWDFTGQILAARTAELGGDAVDVHDRRFLVRRPLLEALEHAGPVVLLIDEIDRADEEFEAFLLELLADFAVTIPELGTVRAEQPPVVVLTSNRTRELHDALKRRCLYHWIDYPSAEREIAIVRARLPEAPQELVERVCAGVLRLRGRQLYKEPGIGETLSWTRALMALGRDVELTAALGAVLKAREDIDVVLREAMLSDG